MWSGFVKESWKEIPKQQLLPEAYPRFLKASKMKHFETIVNDFYQINVLKFSILDVSGITPLVKLFMFGVFRT